MAADFFTKICFLALFLPAFSFASLAESKLLYSYCSNATTLTGNGVYAANINHLFSYLSTNATEHDGFFNTNAEQEPNMVYGLFLCCGDVHPENCRDCINLAAAVAPQLCPNRTWAIIWYEECMLRYSNQSIFSSMAEKPRVDLWHDTNYAPEPERFNRLVGTVMKEIASRASYATLGAKKFATKEATFTVFQTLYSLAQCTPDISSEDCYRCLQDAVRDLLIHTNGNTSGFGLHPSSGPPVSPPEKSLLLPPPAPGWKASKKLIARRNRYDGSKIRALKSLQFDLSIIEAATNNFAKVNKIGAGGFGSVYKGILTDGQEIAVKRLSTSSGQGADEFQTEVVLVAKLQHRNLVKLLGYCLERKERILVYEFVPNKSLDHFIFDPEKQRQLDWPQRYKIIKGIARGLLYLHSDSRLKIIRRDLKASNILLDEDIIPKISDFGMAKIVGRIKAYSIPRESPAHKYAVLGRFSEKSDVFSFGILILEIVCGKRNTSFCHSAYTDNLPTYVWRQRKNGKPIGVMNSALGDSYVSNEVVRCIHIGLLCVQEDPEARPTMARVVLMLSSSSVTLPLPQRTAFYFGTITEGKPSRTDYKSDQSTSMVSSSSATVNETSLTELFPR
ncbi:hypothetical protein GOBAR_AA37431 [Gossypium barbadense]|uniref:Cysteine-rich receptor-like protein kinase 25 n=1 Tax=Gossypium barbadense TaxID=3634 RepID=A0A2P5VWR9_GOSBA|nr:hypothetical protein GOBAR_AA37431 [Gossypium barbadense]